jgi:hypothetical protein
VNRCREEAAGEAQQALARAERRPAAAQHHQVRVQAEIIDVVQAEEAVPRLALTVEQGEDQAGELRRLVVQEVMSGEVNNPGPD